MKGTKKSNKLQKNQFEILAQYYLFKLQGVQILKLIINALRLYELAIIFISAASVRDFKNMHICLCLIESQSILHAMLPIKNAFSTISV